MQGWWGGCVECESMSMLNQTLTASRRPYKVGNYKEDINSIASLKLNQSAIDIIDQRVIKSLNYSNYIIFSKLKSNQIN